MLDFLTYDAKVAVLIAVFYLFYRLVLSKETFHRVNRVVLLLTAVMSFVLPLCVITMHETVVVAAMPAVEIGEVQAVVADKPDTPLWQIALPVLFIIGVVTTLGYTVTSLANLMLLIRHSEKHRQEDGVVICVTDRKVSPFSWFHYIVLSRQDYTEHDAAVLAHERAHIRLRHSWDVLLVDTLTALQWFNPAMWMLRQDLRAIHEYEADGAVLSQGFNARQYQYLLITKESRRSHLLKLLALVPIVGTAMALNAETVTDYQYQTPQKKQIIKKGKKAATIKADGGNEIVVIERTVTPQNTDPVEMPNGMEVEKTEKAFDVVEQMPQYPGGPAALMQFLAQNIRYPEEAHKAGVQGRVIVSFVVETDGSISEAKAVKSVSSELDAEALRVINCMPNWNPGRQNGEVVRVKYVVPVTFRLQDDDKPAVSHVKLGTDHKGKEFEVMMDGQVVDAEVLNSINPADIESMHVEKAKDGQPKDRIILKMKQKK